MYGDFNENSSRGPHLSQVISPTRAERIKWWTVTLLPVVPVVVFGAVEPQAQTL
jgi:hypothetical protein